MGREVRRVPKDWKHPTDEFGRFKPLHDWPFKARAAEWDRDNALWQRGEHPDQREYPDEARGAFEDWSGTRPDSRDYENTSKGTPISPVMDSPEELARWLVDNNASAFAGQTASYEACLRRRRARKGLTLLPWRTGERSSSVRERERHYRLELLSRATLFRSSSVTVLSNSATATTCARIRC